MDFDGQGETQMAAFAAENGAFKDQSGSVEGDAVVDA